LCVLVSHLVTSPVRVLSPLRYESGRAERESRTHRKEVSKGLPFLCVLSTHAGPK